MAVRLLITVFKRRWKYIHGVEKLSKQAINRTKVFRIEMGKQKLYTIVMVRQSETMVWKTVIKKKVNQTRKYKGTADI